MSDTADAVVVGGGTVGAWCAYFLRQAGLARVVLIEKGFLGQGASSRAAGVVRMQGGTPEAVRLGQWSRRFYLSQRDEIGTDSGFTEQGYLLPCFAEAEVAAAHARMEMQSALGVPVRWLDPDEVDAANPTLAPGQTLGGTFCAQDGFITPPRNVAAYTVALIRTPDYCGICDPMQYSASIMTNPALRADTQHDANQFIADAANGTLPAVSFLKPGDDDGHPGYSTLAGFENFTARAIAAVQNNPALWRNTAIFVTFDESGGYYDSGYIQPVSFFGDGPRVPMLVVSPYARRGFVDHTYTDHVSILKFVEANWGLPPLTSYSEDNLPNPAPGVYVPRNRPAIGNLMTEFNFRSANFGTLPLGVRPEPTGGMTPVISSRLR